MTKKHFIALADVVRETKPRPLREGSEQIALGQWMDMRDALADFCARQNSRFDRARWLGYIAGTNGPNGGAIKK